MTSQNLDEVSKRTEFDRLMTAANVFRRRGDYGQATASVKQALQLFPDNLDAQEFAADMIYAHGDVEKASEYYKAILEADVLRVSAEEKYAKAILDLAEGKRQQGLLKERLENPEKYRSQHTRKPTIAALLSIAPGFGQIYCGHYYKGMGLFGGWVLAWLFFFATLNPSVGVQATQKLSAASLMFGCVAAALHIYSIVSAAGEAEKLGKGKNGKDPSEPE